MSKRIWSNLEFILTDTNTGETLHLGEGSKYKPTSIANIIIKDNIPKNALWTKRILKRVIMLFLSSITVIIVIIADIERTIKNVIVGIWVTA